MIFSISNFCLQADLGKRLDELLELGDSFCFIYRTRLSVDNELDLCKEAQCTCIKIAIRNHIVDIEIGLRRASFSRHEGQTVV